MSFIYVIVDKNVNKLNCQGCSVSCNEDTQIKNGEYLRIPWLHSQISEGVSSKIMAFFCSFVEDSNSPSTEEDIVPQRIIYIKVVLILGGIKDMIGVFSLSKDGILISILVFRGIKPHFVKDWNSFFYTSFLVVEVRRSHVFNLINLGNALASTTIRR